MVSGLPSGCGGHDLFEFRFMVIICWVFLFLFHMIVRLYWGFNAFFLVFVGWGSLVTGSNS